MKLYCQNPLCHENETEDRLRGVGSSKLYTTRKANRYYNNMFCTQSCFHEYFSIFKNRIMEVIGVQGKHQRSKDDMTCRDEYRLQNPDGYYENRNNFEDFQSTWGQRIANNRSENE
jgi:hypothetical protein|tara:strand:- start:236 stop:583 length:348 start_codon:yes stop_codon:yes gene_type:complete